MKIHAYLNYGGNTLEAFRYYEEHLGGKITFLMTQAEMPGASYIPPGLENAVVHARFEVGNSVLFANDVPPEKFGPVRSAYLLLSVESSEEAERIHTALSEGGEIYIPMQETFYAYRFSTVRDKFGALWMIIHDRPPQ